MKEKISTIIFGGLIGLNTVGLLFLYTAVVPALNNNRVNMYNELSHLDSMQSAKIGELVEANNNIISYLRYETQKGGAQ